MFPADGIATKGTQRNCSTSAKSKRRKPRSESEACRHSDIPRWRKSRLPRVAAESSNQPEVRSRAAANKPGTTSLVIGAESGLSIPNSFQTSEASFLTLLAKICWAHIPHCDAHDRKSHAFSCHHPTHVAG